MARVRVDELGEAIERELTLYSKDIIDGVKKEARTHMRELVKTTKATAPVGRREGQYRDNIASEKYLDNHRAIGYRWYVKSPDYRLTHLLNNGHQLRDGGRYEGTHFLDKAVEPIIEDYLNAVEEVIKNG